MSISDQLIKIVENEVHSMPLKFEVSDYNNGVFKALIKITDKLKGVSLDEGKIDEFLTKSAYNHASNTYLYTKQDIRNFATALAQADLIKEKEL